MHRSLLILLGLLTLAACNRHAPSASQPQTASRIGRVLPCCAQAAHPASAPLPDTSLYLLDSPWRDQANRPRALTDFRGHVTVMALIFTHCAYACPRILADMRAIEAQTPPDDLADVRWLLISMDSERDTPDVLAAYAQENHLPSDRWTLLHGDAAAVRSVAAVLGVRYKQDAQGNFSHSSLITVLDTDGRIAKQLEGLGVPTATGVQAIQACLRPQ